jgi:hypothetical protein
MQLQVTSKTLTPQQKIWLRILTVIAIAVLLYFRPSFEQRADGHKDPGSPVDEANRVDQPSGQTHPGTDKAPNRTTGASTGPSANDSRVSSTEDRSTSSDRGDATSSLWEVGRNVHESAAGLLYRSGSADGHRLKHVMEHAEDAPDKVIHGVFDEPDQETVVALIDEAYLQTRVSGNRDVRQKRQGDRMVYTIHLSRRVGYVGGQEGKRKGHPECRYVRIVLEDENSVVTAYPTNSF